MTVNLKKFTQDLDRLLNGQPPIGNDLALQTATLLLSIDVDTELSPPADLRVRWLSSVQKTHKRRSLMQTLRARPLLAVLFILFMLLTLTSIVYAIGKVTGYIPGVGIVDQSTPLRILAEPIVVTKDGLTITVSQLVTDANRTFVAYAVDGIVIPRDKPPICHAMPLLQLPDGSTLNFSSGGAGGYGGQVGSTVRFETSLSYPPIPVGVDHVILTFPCILTEGTGPENWQIPLELSLAPDDYATPGIEVGATFVASNPKFITSPTPTSDVIFTPEPYDPSFPATPTVVPNGSGLYLDRVIELADSYILVGNFTDAGDLPGPLVVSSDPYDNLPEIKDANGKPVDYKVRDDIQPAVNWGGVRYWAFEVPKAVRAPLTITFDHIDVNADHFAQYNFDTGPDPKPGQIWELNFPIHLSKYDYVIDSVEMVENGYRIEYHSGTDAPEGVSLNISFVGHLPDGSSGQLYQGKTTVEYSDEITYTGGAPTGKLTLVFLLMETVSLDGPWTLTWAPPNK